MPSPHFIDDDHVPGRHENQRPETARAKAPKELEKNRNRNDSCIRSSIFTLPVQNQRSVLCSAFEVALYDDPPPSSREVHFKTPGGILCSTPYDILDSMKNGKCRKQTLLPSHTFLNQMLFDLLRRISFVGLFPDTCNPCLLIT